jgi:hypothetical protein
MQEFYATQSAVTDPGDYRPLLDNQPSDLASVAKIAQGLVYHYFAGKYFFGYEPPKERMAEIDTRSLERILTRIIAMDGRPLHEARAYENRIIGCCRDFSLIACTILRHQGIPARLRYGFATYFDPGYWGDHVIVETWTGDHWRRFDPQLAGVLTTQVDLFDIPSDAFVTGGRAWQLCRYEGAEPTRFGLGPGVPEVSGWWFIRGRLLLDLAALHKEEMLCWDQWSYGFDTIEPSTEEETMLDRAAQLSQNSNLEGLTALWQAEDRLHLPEEITCYSPAVGPHQVKI